MAVYVDPVQPVPKSRNWRWKEACHLFADTMKELLEMAGRLGLAPGWLHPAKDFPHFDLTPFKREQAVRLGALQVGIEKSIDYRRAKREGRLRKTPIQHSAFSTQHSG